MTSRLTMPHTSKSTSFASAALSIGAVVILSALANWTGILQSLGAHPWWAAQVLWIGAPMGLALSGLLAWSGASAKRRLALSLALILLTGAAAVWGKAIFAASFAENALAGQAWHFGWIGLVAGCAATTATLTSILAARR